MFKSRASLLTYGACLALMGCGGPATFFSESFLNRLGGGFVPIVPGPEAGYVMVFVVNNTTDRSVEFVVTAEQEEIVVQLDANGNMIGFEPARTLEQRTVDLLTDVDSPTLAIVFDHSAADFPPVGPGELTFQDIQSVLDQIVADDPQALQDREFFRLVRVLRIGLGPDLDVPSGQDDGIVVRPPGSDPAVTAGSIFASGVNKALSYNSGDDVADFGNGDMVIFLAITDQTAVGNIRVRAGVVDGSQVTSAAFRRDTFEILRREEGPISPPPLD